MQKKPEYLLKFYKFLVKISRFEGNSNESLFQPGASLFETLDLRI